MPATAGYALTINKAQGLTLPEGVVIKLSSGPRFKAAAKHGLPFVAFTRSESFARTAFHNLPAWDDFAKGAESEMLRIRLDYTAMLEELRAKSIKRVFRNGQKKREREREREREKAKWERELRQRDKERGKEGE